MRPSNASAVPPGGLFRYKDPETGLVIAHPYYVTVLAKATKHRQANNLPIPVNWEQVFADNVCTNTPTCPCEPDESEAVTMGRMVSSALQAAAEWARSGFKTVKGKMLEHRTNICCGNSSLGIPRCSHWGGGDTLLSGRCGKCGCRGVKLYLATERCPIGKWERVED